MHKVQVVWLVFVMTSCFTFRFQRLLQVFFLAKLGNITYVFEGGKNSTVKYKVIDISKGYEKT